MVATMAPTLNPNGKRPQLALHDQQRIPLDSLITNSSLKRVRTALSQQSHKEIQLPLTTQRISQPPSKNHSLLSSSPIPLMPIIPHLTYSTHPTILLLHDPLAPSVPLLLTTSTIQYSSTRKLIIHATHVSAPLQEKNTPAETKMNSNARWLSGKRNTESPSRASSSTSIDSIHPLPTISNIKFGPGVHASINFSQKRSLISSPTSLSQPTSPNCLPRHENVTLHTVYPLPRVIIRKTGRQPLGRVGTQNDSVQLAHRRKRRPPTLLRKSIL